ncbi:protein FAR1-RELATED SEQUENCE 5-like [Asparagus officinalis]|uniref:protein FAR1-RELATED SEQUENCE 5-like n=1 Tax=Asparagus officinalis TaxID=4686 RepID=UPI00098E8422|nr:protein FAR1-RELATED SEQUENCE 5-like [Asparagus officinalis]
MTDIEEFDDVVDDALNNCPVDERSELPQHTDQQIEQNEPKIGMEFNDPDELFEFYKDYAKNSGFPIKKHTRRKNEMGIVRSMTLVCGRAGKHNSTCQNPLKPQASYRVGCNAKITARLNLDGRWEISVVVLEHNHGLSPSKSRFFRCNRRISAHVRHQINLNDQAGIRINKNFSSLVHEAGGYENLLCDEKACRNLVDESRRLRLGEDHLKNVFWADGRSREAYKEFGEVVTFDTTYLTNKYDMPFAPFVGVNHHGQSILLGCGLISKEDTKTFIWLFTKWVECMDGCAPQGIINDQARAMKNAIEIVFPNTRHRWCLWHIMKKLSEKLGRYTEYEAISSTMKGVVYDAQSPQEFEQ